MKAAHDLVKKCIIAQSWQAVMRAKSWWRVAVH